MNKVISVKVVGEYNISVEFADKISGTVDLSCLKGKGVFATWDDPDFFKQVKIGEHGELCWGDKIDICSDNLYMMITGKKPEDIFPALRKEAVHA